MAQKSHFDALAAAIVDHAATPGDLWQACHDLYALLLEVTGLPPQEYAPEVAAATRLPTGKAIAPLDAARCLLDPFRTQAFAGGVVDAIAERRRADPSRPVQVLYAGCGPFATLLLPALTRFTPDELRCTLIDLHRLSIDAVETVVTTFGLAGCVATVELGDAATYRSSVRPDVVVVECLLRGLTSEPQVAITWNLVGQAGPEVLLVPAEIRLDLVVTDGYSKQMGPARPLPRLGTDPVFTLSRDAVLEWGPYDPATEALPAGTMTVGRAVLHPERLALATMIRTHGDRMLGDYRSGLNQPLLLDHPASLPAGTDLAFRYSLTKPGIELTEIS